MKGLTQSNVFIELGELLYPGKGKQKIEIDQANELSVNSGAKQFLDPLDWCRAFDIFSAAYTLKHPECGQALISYAHRIRALMKKKMNWFNYDVRFGKRSK